MSGTSCKNKQPSSLWIQGDSLANVHIAPQHRSLTNELVFQLLQHHYSEFNELFGLSSCLYHQEQQENTTSNTLSSPIQLKSPSSSHSNSTSSINSSKNQPSSLTSGTTPEDHVNSMMHHHHRRELSRQSSLSQEINFSSPTSTTNMKDFDPTTHHMMNNSPSVIVTTKNAEEDRMAMPPPPPKIKQPPSTPTQSSFRNSENYHSLFAMRSGGVELCILSNVTNEMIFIDPRLVKYSTRLQQNDLIVSSALDKSMINTQSTTESPSIIVSPRLRMQHHRWSTYYNHPVHQEDKPLLEQQLSIRKEQSFSSSTSSIDTSSVTPSLVNPASHDEIDAMSQGKPSDTTISAIENSSFLSTGKIYKHHHTISSLNKKEFQQFLPRVSLPNYGDISSVFNLNAEVIQEIGMMDSTLSHHQLVDMLSHNHSGNFSKSSKLSKSFTFGSEKNNSNVSIGTTMTFSSIRVPRQSPRNSTRRSTRNSFSFFGKQYIKGEQYKLKNSSTSIDISSLANEKLGRESVSSEVEAFTNPTSALEGRRYTETDCHPTSSLDIIDLKPVPFSTQRRATTVETTTVNASSSPPIVISKPTSHSTTSVNSSSSIPNSGISPTSPLDIHTSNSTLKTPEKKKTPSTMSSKVKEFFSSIGRRKKKATSSMDMNSNVTNNENSSSPPRHSPQPPPQFKTNHSDTITISPLSSSPISPVKSLPMADIVVHRASCSSTCSNADEHSEANGSQHGNNSTTTTTTSLSSSPPPLPTDSEQQLHKTIQVIETPPPPQKQQQPTSMMNGRTNSSLLDREALTLTITRKSTDSSSTAPSTAETPKSPKSRRSSMKKSPKRKELSCATPNTFNEIEENCISYLTNLIVDFKTSSIAFAKLVEELSEFENISTPTMDVTSGSLSVSTPKGTKSRRPTSMHYISRSSITSTSMDLSLAFSPNSSHQTTSNVFHCLNERGSNFSIIVLRDVTICLWYNLSNHGNNKHTRNATSINIDHSSGAHENNCVLNNNQKKLLFGGVYDEKLKTIGYDIETKLRAGFILNKQSAIQNNQNNHSHTLKTSRSMEFGAFLTRSNSQGACK